MKPINFKNTLYTGTALTLIATFFVHPIFSLLIGGYYFFRGSSLLLKTGKYEAWRQEKFAQTDRSLTFRKLLYLMKKSKQYNIGDTKIYAYYDTDFRLGVLKVDNYTYIELTKNSENFKYKARVRFEQHVIDTSKGYSFQPIKWKTKKYPDLERALSKGLAQLEQSIQQYEEQEKRAKQKAKKNEKKELDAYEYMLAKKINKAYKKDLDI